MMDTELLSWGQIIARMLWQFMPVWVALIFTFALTFTFRARLGLWAGDRADVGRSSLSDLDRTELGKRRI